MYIERIYTGCLAEASYYIESAGEAAVVDPMREPEPYIELAESRGARIKYIFETHFHADFVSGHLDLSRKTGAQIIYGPMAETGYDVLVAQDGQEFPLGDVTIRVLHTPGHTLESSCFLLLDSQGKPHAVFTGDTLFAGEVGRPDLAVKGDELTKEDLAGMLYDSLHKVLMKLPDDVIVYPAHGAGSACGKNISDEAFTTIGTQRKTNYALQAKNREEFIKLVTDGILPPPKYFPLNVELNRNGYEAIDAILSKNVKPVNAEKAYQLKQNGVLILDTRAPEVYCQQHITGSYNIGLDGFYASWAGTLIPDDKTPLLILAEPGRETEAITRLARIGFTEVAGYLDGGIHAWIEAGYPVVQLPVISAEELAMQIQNHFPYRIIDARRPQEFVSGHVPGATNFPLDFLHDNIDQLNPEEPLAIYCHSGYRSVIMCSVLRHRGFKNVVNIAGGICAIRQTDIDIAIKDEPTFC